MPDIVPLTILMRILSREQVGYNTNFFHGRADGSFIGDYTYFGCHLYPQGGSSGTVHNYEISAGGGDDIVDENGNSTLAVYDVWTSQAARAANDGAAGVGVIDYFYSVPNYNKIISTTLGAALANSSNSPALIFGDAPWSANNERLSGVLRGVMVFQAKLTTTQIGLLEVCESDAAVLNVCSANSIGGLWYCNINPTPSDISDKSGNAHHPAWVSSDHGTLWTE